jgi:Leucine-rich repeat (LRR) protein
MEKIMMRMEEKLAHVSSLESRCEQLEAKCSSLENKLETTSQSMKVHFDNKIDSLHLHLETKCDSLVNRLETKVDSVHVKVDKSLKFHEYNEMLIKNQSWEYSAPVVEKNELLFDTFFEDEAEHLADNAEELKQMTLNMRRGEFPDESNGIYLEMNDSVPPFSYVVNDELLPHWREFAAALKQFSPAINMLPDDCESYFCFYYVQLNGDAMLLIKEALMNKTFKTLSFTHNNNGDGERGGMSIDAIMDIVESNKHLRKLEIERNRIEDQHIERLCSAVHKHHFVELDLSESFEPGIGDVMLTSLLTNHDLKLEKLSMSSNNITSGVSTLLADFLATNPRLKELDLNNNHLNDSDAVVIANALRSNTTLRILDLADNNNVTDVGAEAFRIVLCDESSLNSVAGSNDSCSVYGFDDFCWTKNRSELVDENRGRKIYSILSFRNKMMSNVQHFDDVDVKLLPKMLESVQRYSKYVVRGHKHDSIVEALSIVYEVMRKWDKVFPLYHSSGVGNNDT